jgi:acetate---CoA ligase (ADP-forming)
VALELARATVDDLDGRKPLLGVFISPDRPPLPTSRTGRRVPAYSLPEPAVSALARAVRYARWRATPAETAPALADVQSDQAAILLSRALRDRRIGSGRTRFGSCWPVMACHSWSNNWCDDADAAAAAAEALGKEVALKAVLPGAAHKAEVGGVRLHLAGAAAVRGAAEAMSWQVQAATGHTPMGFLVQHMAEAGVEMLVGVVNDARFGPTVACSSGGLLVELVRGCPPGAPLALGRGRDGPRSAQLSSIEWLPRQHALCGRGPRGRVASRGRPGRCAIPRSRSSTGTR